MASGAIYTPLTVSVGKLPDISEKICCMFPIPDDVPPNATEILVYAFATTNKEGKEFHRGWYDIFTSQGSAEFKQCMNIAVGPSITINSANMWFPLSPKERNIKVILNTPGYSGSVAHKNKAKPEDEFSDIFIMGYRTS